MLLFAWLACGKDGAHDSATGETLPFEPTSGSYVVTMASKFEGCALDDPKTGHIADDHWDFLIEGDKIRWWQGNQTSRIGTMDGLEFYFDLGTYITDLTAGGVDAVQAITYSTTGTFDSATSFRGSSDIAAACEGADCAKVGIGWGSGFEYPCVASASFVGTSIGE
jgi:hypothetical protein